MDEFYSLLYERWKAGNLSRLLLYDHQIQIYDKCFHSKARKFVIHCSRRLGKSATLLVMANETALRKKSTIRYGAATQKDVREIIIPLMDILTREAPKDIKPVWHEAKGKFIYPTTGSELVVSGLDEGRADNLRGTGMDLGIIDEAGFVDDLDYAIKSVLMPQLLTTGGRIVMGSSSPRTPSHPFIYFIEEARQNDAYIKLSIYDDSRKEVIDRIPEWMKEAGGAESTTWRREYLCEIITDEESALVPEFNDKKALKIVRPYERPPHFIPYTVMDLGYIDFTAVIFGYVDFIKAKLVIEDEILMNRKDSKFIAEAIKKKEQELFGKMPVRRVADGPLLTVQDFNALHNLPFDIAAKDELEAEVNQLRLEVQSESIIIHPRCLHTIAHLKYGVWDKAHKKFARDPSQNFGHYDCVAALMYFVRHANKRENPYPENWGMSIATHHISVPTNQDQELKDLEGAFFGNRFK